MVCDTCCRAKTLRAKAHNDRYNVWFFKIKGGEARPPAIAASLLVELPFFSINGVSLSTAVPLEAFGRWPLIRLPETCDIY